MIGRDLLDLPFAEMVRNLAVAIADGQAALDRNSLDTLRALVNEEVEVLTEITEIIAPEVTDVLVKVTGSDGRVREDTVSVTGARVTASGAKPVSMNMLQAGLFPTFYQFTEAIIEVRLSITMRDDRQTTTSGERPEGPRRFLDMGRTRAFASTVDYRTANSYSYQASGASLLRATMRPVPAPSRLQPTTTTINTFTTPPTVVVN